jgi:ankyrin repeat protein
MDPAWQQAVTRGDLDAVRRLIRSGANINARNRHGQTALMVAAHRGDRAMVEELVVSGADLDVTAKYKLSALMLAVVAGHTAVACVLARAGANLGIRGTGAPGFTGKTAYDLAVARSLEEVYADLDPGDPERRR